MTAEGCDKLLYTHNIWTLPGSQSLFNCIGIAESGSLRCMANQEALALGAGEHESSLGDQRQRSARSVCSLATLDKSCMNILGWH